MNEAAAVIQRHLAEDEPLLWSGQPRTGLRLRPADALMIPFSLLWGGFAFFWEWSVVTSGGPVFFALWGVPFVAMGLYIIVGRFFGDSYRRGRTFYGLTSRRAIIVTQALGVKIKSLDLRTLSDVTMTESGDRSGTIQLGPSMFPYASWWSGAGWPGMAGAAPSFELLDEVRSIYDLILRAQRGIPEPRGVA